MNGLFSYAEIGEKYKENALPWDQIPTANFETLNKFDTQQIALNSQNRLSQNQNYQLLLESAQWRKTLDKEEKISLKLDKFLTLMKERKEYIKKFKALQKYDNQLKFELHQDEKERLKKDEAFAKKSESWLKNLKKDIYLKEAVEVINEIK